MADKYLDNLNGAAVDDVTAGTQVKPYLTIAYALSQAAAGDNIYVGNGTTYTLAATNLNVAKSIFFLNWNNRAGAKPKIDGGDATRLIFINTANAVVFDGFIMENNRVTPGNYICESRPAVRNVRYRNCDFIGAPALGAVNANAASSGTVVESTCTFNMTSGAAIYTSPTGGIECYGNITLNGVAQAAFFISNGASGGTDFVLGGDITLLTTDNYVFRCGSTNSDADITIHSSFRLVSVPSNYTRATFEILNPRTFIVQPGAYIDTRNSTNVTNDVWVRSPGKVVVGSVLIDGLQIDRASISGHTLFIGDESPFSASHTPNSYSSCIVRNCLIRDGKYFGTAGTTQSHVIFIGNEKYHKVYNNKLIEGAYGLGIKGDDTADPTSFFYNNYVQGMRLAHMKTKGFDHTRWINNYIVENGKGGVGLDLTDNTDNGAAGLGNASLARNNIFVMSTAVAVNVDAASDLGDNDIDYNSYYMNGQSIASFGASTYSTLAALQAAKKVDLHSYSLVASGPLLESNLLSKINTENYQTGIPFTDMTVIKDVSGSDTVTLSGVRLSEDAPYKRSLSVFV